MKKTVSVRATWVVWLALVAAAALVAGCSGQKEPANNAVTGIETTLNSIHDDAMKYAATELQQADAGLAALKDSLAKKDYKSVLAAAPAVSAQVAALQSSVAAKKAEAQAAMAAAGDQWRVLSADVPNMVSAIQSRIDTLSQAKKLPKTLTADAFQSAKDGLEFMKTTWSEATQQFGTGNAVDAVAKANTVKDKGAEVLKLLGMGQ
ncbi:MAG TPA: hypothetical protein VGN07_19105 [Steroidobacteraceae bacterium]|jgi:hypothetical protein